MKNNTIRAWLVFASCVLISFGGIGLFMNCTGLVFSAIIGEFGFRSGDLSLYYTLRLITQALTVSLITANVIRKPKLGCSILALAGFLNFFLMIFFTQCWQWYISGILAGISMGCIFVIIPIILNNWFRKYNGTLIGISMSASGISGAVFQPIVSWIILNYGWRAACLFLGIGGALLLALPAVLFIRTTPEEIGMKPYGYVLGEGAEKAARTKFAGRNLPKYAFALTAAAIICGTCFNQFLNQIPMFALSVGYTLTTGAAITSYMQIGNFTGKTVFGFMSDRIGIFRTIYIMAGVTAAAFLLFLFGQGSAVLLSLAGLLFGISFSLSTTSPPIVMRTVFGDVEYQKRIPQYQAANSIVSAVNASSVPYIYDFTGSYNPVFIAALLLIAVSVFAYTRVAKMLQKAAA